MFRCNATGGAWAGGDGSDFCRCARGCVGVGPDALRLRPPGLLGLEASLAGPGLAVNEEESSLWSWTRFMWSNRLYLRGKPFPGMPRSQPG